MAWNELLAILSFLFVLVGFLIQNLVVAKNMQREFDQKCADAKEESMKNFALINDRVKELEVKISLFWGLVEKYVPNIIHSPHTPNIDFYLEKLTDSKLETEEVIILRDMLREQIDREDDKVRILAMILLISALDQEYKDRRKE